MCGSTNQPLDLKYNPLRLKNLTNYYHENHEYRSWIKRRVGWSDDLTGKVWWAHDASRGRMKVGFECM
jgi:hypothetical protein